MNKQNFGSITIAVYSLVTGLLLAGCAGFKKVPSVTVGEIVQMSRAGVPSADITAKISKSGTVYRMEASELAKLKEQGVSDEVIDYMQKTYLNAVARDQRLESRAYWSHWDDGYWYGSGIPY